MNIALDSSVKAVDFNGQDIAEVIFNGASVWKKPAAGQIFGVSWKTSTGTADNTSLTRTDDSANFVDPDPYVADDNHPGSSPFDDIMPWSGMVKETYDGNVMVKIPKFWYKIDKAQDGTLSIKIANYAADGFHVSPAHRARGLESEHDYVWIGRYHCDSDYKSTSGMTQLTSITRATARAGCHNLGSNYWMLDYSMWITIQLLYIVEFANWNSQSMIGYGGKGSSREPSGATDSMPYHTGTMRTSRASYGSGVQYRYIEDLWCNAWDFCDGITFKTTSVYCFENPVDYSDDYRSAGATLVGTRSSETTSNATYIQDFSVSTETGYEWFLYPSSVGTNKRNIPDSCQFSSTGVVLQVGGASKFEGAGMFYLSGVGQASSTGSAVGTRLQRR